MPPELPRDLPAWGPYLWRNVLFPGPAPTATRARPWALALLLVLPALLLYPSRSYLLLEPDEGRYAQIGLEMYASGDWVVPTLQGEPYLDKPPLFYWLVSLSYALFGVSDASARLVPALAVHLTILLVYLIGRRSLGERSAFWAALLLAVCPGYVGMGRLLILDGLLTLIVTGVLLCAYEAVRHARLQLGWWLAASVCCGLGVLCKGPVALVLLAIPLTLGRLTGSVAPVSWRALAGLAGVVLAVNLPWYAAMGASRPEFLGYFLWEHNVLRFVSPFDHLQPVWYYVPVVLAGLLPATLLLWPALKFLSSAERAGDRPAALGWWLSAGLGCVLFFSCSGSKLPTYVLPAFPCLMLAAGHCVAHTRWAVLVRTRVAVAASAAVLALAVYVAIPRYAEARSPVGRPELVMPLVTDPEAAVVAFPKGCDSVAFYSGRTDVRAVRSKFTQTLVEDMLTRTRTVVLFTHRHSFDAFKGILPPMLRVTHAASLKPDNPTALQRIAGLTPWGLSDIVVVENSDPPRRASAARPGDRTREK